MLGLDMKRSYYSENFESFVKNSDDQILGELTKQHKFELTTEVLFFLHSGQIIR